MNDVQFVDMPLSTQVVPLTQLAARFNLSERAMKDRLRDLNIPIVKAGRIPSVFVADVTRMISIVTRRLGQPADRPERK